jgi:hypothetical protein
VGGVKQCFYPGLALLHMLPHATPTGLPCCFLLKDGCQAVGDVERWVALVHSRWGRISQGQVDQVAACMQTYTPLHKTRHASASVMQGSGEWGVYRLTMWQEYEDVMCACQQSLETACT